MGKMLLLLLMYEVSPPRQFLRFNTIQINGAMPTTDVCGIPPGILSDFRLYCFQEVHNYIDRKA